MSAQDMDGDSEMRSSPDGSDTEIYQFTTSSSKDDPATPTGSHLSPVEKLRMVELSPPTSQDPSGHDGSADIQTASLASEEQRAKSGEPGTAWMNKKAQEDWHRALGDVVDKDFSLKEFGDPFGDGEISSAQNNGGP